MNVNYKVDLINTSRTCDSSILPELVLLLLAPQTLEPPTGTRTVVMSLPSVKKHTYVNCKEIQTHKNVDKIKKNGNNQMTFKVMSAQEYVSFYHYFLVLEMEY